MILLISEHMPDPDVYRYLRTLGEVVHVSTAQDGLAIVRDEATERQLVISAVPDVQTLAVSFDDLSPLAHFDVFVLCGPFGRNTAPTAKRSGQAASPAAGARFRRIREQRAMSLH